MDKEEFRTNLSNTNNWLRLLFMLLFGVVCWLLGIILPVVIIAQVLFSLITGRDNINLRHLGGNLSIYFFQILHFLTYNTEEKPFPFAPFPSSSELEKAAQRSGNSKQDGDVFSDMSFARPGGRNDKAEDQVDSKDDEGGEGEAPRSSS